MTLKEAFYKQKDELRAANCEIKRLNKALEASRKGVATDETIQKQLSHIRGLNNKISALNNIVERYKHMCEMKDSEIKSLKEKNIDLEFKVIELEQRVSFLSDEDGLEKLLPLKDAEEKIRVLSEEVARLTARLDSDGTTAGIPTSKTPINKTKHIPNSREKSSKKKGGQPGHQKHEMKNFSEDEITETTDHTLTECPICGSHNLEEMDVTVKDEYDYEVKVIKHRHRFVEYKCLDCGKIVRAPLGSLVAPNQYGKVIQAMALSLLDLGFVSINRAQKILTGLSPEPISLSEGYLSKLQKRFSKKLKPFVAAVKARLVSLPLLYWDDTVVFVNTARACMRFYGDERLALYTAHMHKDLDSIIADNILPMLSEGTTVMHDHNTINYHRGFKFKNIECLQHLERDLKRILEISYHKWAEELLALIRSRIHKRKELIKKGIDHFQKEYLQDTLRTIERILDDGYKEYIADLGHYYEKDENALLNRLEAYKQNYFAWLRDFSLPTTNNLSERSLRFVKTKDKVSGQFQSIDYASFFADIRTYLETCSRNGINQFAALVRLTSGHPYTLDEVLSENLI